MQKIKNQLECHPAFLLREVGESAFEQVSRISVVDDHQVEQNIFIYKNETFSEYEVRIYKKNPADSYLPVNLNIPLKKYVANDFFASFFFSEFYFACLFISQLAELHPESLIRPVLENMKK